MAIHILETCFVKPATPTKRHTLALSGLDLYWRSYGYACTLNFYKTQTQDQFASIVCSLKRSLSVLLVDFYPVGGRLVEDVGGRLTLDCNDAGVEFKEAWADTDFGRLEAMDFAVQEFFPALTRTGKRVGNEDPLLSVQVTSFVGGGVAIGVSTEHMLFDGFCFASFMKGWSECCKGVPLSSPPCHMRRIMSHSAIDPDHLQLPISSSSSAATHRSDSLQGAAPAIENDQEVEIRMVPLTADMVEKLKLEAAKYSAEGGGADMKPFTTFECLAAYLWKARTKADKQQSVDDDVALRVRVNLRPRLDPKLPATYFGPAVILAEVSAMKSGELIRESLGATAGRIHEAICTYTKQERIRQTLESYESGTAAYGEQEETNMVVTEIADNRRVDFYNAEFDWGVLKAVRPATAKHAGVLSLSPPRGGGGGASGHILEVILRLTTTEMQSLLPCLF